MQPTPIAGPLAAGLIAFLVFVPGLQARDPAARINPAKRNDVYTSDQQVKPDVKPPQLDDSLQQKRFDTGQVKEQPRAPEADRRAPFDLKESKDKNLVTPERKTYDKIEYDRNAMSEQRADRFKTGEQTYRTSLSDRYQSSLHDAEDAAPKTTVKKRTTFESLNRFVFRRNGDAADATPVAAGSEPAAAASAAPSAQP